jgi:hypothetical protein
LGGAARPGVLLHSQRAPSKQLALESHKATLRCVDKTRVPPARALFVSHK